MEPTAFMIYGPESSGNRLLRRILLCAGCHGDPDRVQRFDVEGPPDPRDYPLIVWGRSVPGNQSRHAWPRFYEQDIGEVRKRGYTPFGLVLVRDWFCMIESQIQTEWKVGRYWPENEGWTREAYLRIFDAMDRLNVVFVVISFEALVMRPAQFTRRLMDHLGLELVKEPEVIYDANERHYHSWHEMEKKSKAA